MQCSGCQTEVGEADAFCSACGQNLLLPTAHSESQKILEINESATMQAGERRQVTAMFADVVGSTPLAEKSARKLFIESCKM